MYRGLAIGNLASKVGAEFEHDGTKFIKWYSWNSSNRTRDTS